MHFCMIKLTDVCMAPVEQCLSNRNTMYMNPHGHLVFAIAPGINGVATRFYLALLDMHVN